MHFQQFRYGVQNVGKAIIQGFQIFVDLFETGAYYIPVQIVEFHIFHRHIGQILIQSIGKFSFHKNHSFRKLHFYNWPTRSRLGFKVSAPGCHLAGHTSSPCSATNWQAWTFRSSSSALRPTLPALTS